MVICLEQGANDLHMVQLMPLPPHHLLLQQNPEWFILLEPAYPGCPGKKATKRLCVCSLIYSTQGIIIAREFNVSTNHEMTIHRVPLYFDSEIQGLSRSLKLHFQGPILDGSLQHGQ